MLIAFLIALTVASCGYGGSPPGGTPAASSSPGY
jgi:hypothetical protein